MIASGMVLRQRFPFAENAAMHVRRAAPHPLSEASQLLSSRELELCKSLLHKTGNSSGADVEQ
jgi:hypothetical protein